MMYLKSSEMWAKISKKYMDLILFVRSPWHGINNVPDPCSFSRFQGKDAPFNCSSTPCCTYLLFTEHLQQAVIKDAQVEMLQAA